jgi:hypothetical protein
MRIDGTDGTYSTAVVRQYISLLPIFVSHIALPISQSILDWSPSFHGSPAHAGLGF